MSGTIYSNKKPATFGSFDFRLSQEKPPKFNALVFQGVPGFDLHEYNPNVRELWNDVRRIVTKYLK